jgi:uncharacterized membrane protein
MRTTLSLISLLCLLQVLVGCSPQAPEHQIVIPAGERVNISLDRVNDGGVHFFTYKWEGRNINFFVRTDGTGHLQAHFDACYSEVVCIACRIGYRLEDVIWDYIGACAPINLKSRISNGHLTIRRASLEKGKRFF